MQFFITLVHEKPDTFRKGTVFYSRSHQKSILLPFSHVPANMRFHFCINIVYCAEKPGFTFSNSFTQIERKSNICEQQPNGQCFIPQAATKNFSCQFINNINEKKEKKPVSYSSQKNFHLPHQAIFMNQIIRRINMMAIAMVI